MKVHYLTQYQTLCELSKIRGVDYADWIRRKHRLGESILVDVPMGVSGMVEADGVRRKNLILSNFAVLMYGLLLDSDLGPMADFNGASGTHRTSGDVNDGAAWIATGTGTSPPAVTDYALTSRTDLSTYRNVGFFDTETQVILTATATGSFNEVGVLQRIFIVGTGSRYILLARSLMSGSSGTQIVYRIRFQQPWLANYAQFMYGILSDTNFSMTDISNTPFTARTGGDANASAVYIVGSSSSLTWSPTLTSIPGAFQFTTSYTTIIPRTFAILILIGYLSPASSTTLATLGLYQNIYDASGATKTAALGVIPLPQPIDMPAGRLTVVFVRLIVM